MVSNNNQKEKIDLPEGIWEVVCRRFDIYRAQSNHLTILLASWR